MNETLFCCRDCTYYLPVDVFKGICKFSKESIIPDAGACGVFKKLMKCRFCANFTFSESNEFLGKCMNEHDAYPDMTSVTCGLFKWK